MPNSPAPAHSNATSSAALSSCGVKPSSTLDVRADVSACTVTHREPFPYQLDGDYLGEVTSLDFKHVPEAILLVRPNTAIVPVKR